MRKSYYSKYAVHSVIGILHDRSFPAISWSIYKQIRAVPSLRWIGTGCVFCVVSDNRKQTLRVTSEYCSAIAPRYVSGSYASEPVYEQ